MKRPQKRHVIKQYHKAGNPLLIHRLSFVLIHPLTALCKLLLDSSNELLPLFIGMQFCLFID
jgi:hypothetical protein